MLHVVIVGRPNVGKSALLNRLVKRTVSIVHDQPGVTRDRIRAVVQRNGKSFEFVDTGGIGLFENETTSREVARAVRIQTDIAIKSADLILVVVDGMEGTRPLDHEILAGLRKTGKTFWLVVNKLDLPAHEARATDFFQFGIDPLFPVSASHGRGIDLLWEALINEELKRGSMEVPGLDARTTAIHHIAIVGRPNVGKSSLINRLLRAERVIVSDVPGTTRDSVELPIEFKGVPYMLIDTAGMRQKTKIRTNVEMYSRHWTEKSIVKSHVVLLMLDALDGLTRQDREIASLILKHQKPCIILVNKWDLNKIRRVTHRKGKPHDTRCHGVSRSEYEKNLRYSTPFLDYAPVMFISALQGYHALAIWEEVGRISRACRANFTTGVLNRIFSRAQQRVQPPMRQHKRLRIYYGIQKTEAPVPTFLLFVNQPDLLTNNYGRYLQNQLRKEDPLRGCPIIFLLKSRSSHSEKLRADR